MDVDTYLTTKNIVFANMSFLILILGFFLRMLQWLQQNTCLGQLNINAAVSVW